MVLNIVQGDKDEFRNNHNDICHPIQGFRTYGVDYCWGIDEWKNIDKYLTIGF